MPELIYQRNGALIRFRLRGMTNHEIREVLVGCWKRLSAEDQADHIDELRHYLEPDSRLSPVARAVATGEMF